MHRTNHILLCSAICITITYGLILTGASVYADESVVDEVVIDVPSSCTFGVGGGGTYNIELDNGEDDVVTANNITVSCNDISGYAIYAIGFSGDSYYGTNTDLIHESDTSYNIKTDGTGTYGSSWKMKLTAVSNATIEGNYATAWQNIPSTYVKVASYTANTTEAVITPSYQINISNTQMAGTYTGKVKYTLVHPNTAPAPMMPLNPELCPANNICYAPNANDIVGTMVSNSGYVPLAPITSHPQAASQHGGYDEDGFIWDPDDGSTRPVALTAPNYKREGYGFAGWSTSFDATTEENPIIFGPNELIPYDVDATHSIHDGLILYPVWIAKETNVTMQTFNSTNYPAYNSAPNGTVIALEDERDHDTYAVAKLADGKWWMIENLRLNNEDTTSAEDIAKAQGYGDATASTNNGVSSTNNNLGRFVGLPASEDANFNDSATANSLYSIDGSNGTTNINSNYGPAYRLPRYNNNNTNMTTNATNSDSTTTLDDSYNTNNNHVRWYGYGNYYNWPAAIANTNYYNQNNVSVTNTSICPNGWRLPEGGMAYAEGNTSGVNVTGDTSTYRDFYNLGYILMGNVAYNSQANNGNSCYDNNVTNANGDTATKAFRKFPNNFVYSGLWNGAQAYSRSSSGFYWSSSADSYNKAYPLALYSSSVYPGTISSNRYSGLSVRCVAGS